MKPPMSDDQPLTQEERAEVFKIATRGLVYHYGDQFQTGMTDKELRTALEQSLGTFGGCGGPDRLSVSFKGSGLRIWGGWYVVNHVIEKPIFAGAVTIAMARLVYGIADPDNDQFVLFK